LSTFAPDFPGFPVEPFSELKQPAGDLLLIRLRILKPVYMTMENSENNSLSGLPSGKSAPTSLR